MRIPLVGDFFRQGSAEVEHHLQQLYGEIARLRQDLDDRTRAFNNLYTMVNQVLNAPAARPDARSTELERVLAGHRERIDVLSREMTQRRDDLRSKDYLVHQEIARNLDAFVNQDLVNVALQLPHSTADGELAIAVNIAYLSRALFSDECQAWTVDDLLRWLHEHEVKILPMQFNGLRRTAHTLKDTAQRTGHAHQWQLEHLPKSTFDAKAQQLWPGCDASGIVELVVAPGYYVEGEVYYQQYVFTAAKTKRRTQRKADRPGEPAQVDAGPTEQPADPEQVAKVPSPRKVTATADNQQPAPAHEKAPRGDMQPGQPDATAPARADLSER